MMCQSLDKQVTFYPSEEDATVRFILLFFYKIISFFTIMDSSLSIKYELGVDFVI